MTKKMTRRKRKKEKNARRTKNLYRNRYIRYIIKLFSI